MSECVSVCDFACARVEVVARCGALDGISEAVGWASSGISCVCVASVVRACKWKLGCGCLMFMT